MSANPAFALYALSAVVLALQLLVLAGWTGGVRNKHKQFVNAEDAKLGKGESVTEEHPAVRRAMRAHTNAIENAVPFFVVGALYAATAPGRTGALAYFGAFVAARVLHSFFYLFGRQPFRTLAFATGVLAILGMGVHVIRFYA